MFALWKLYGRQISFVADTFRSWAAQAFDQRQPSGKQLFKARVPESDFGTCSLKLRGLREREYRPLGHINYEFGAS